MFYTLLEGLLCSHILPVYPLTHHLLLHFCCYLTVTHRRQDQNHRAEDLRCRWHRTSPRGPAEGGPVQQTGMNSREGFCVSLEILKHEIGIMFILLFFCLPQGFFKSTHMHGKNSSVSVTWCWKERCPHWICSSHSWHSCQCRCRLSLPAGWHSK